MINVNGEKLSKEDVDILFVQACHSGDLAKVVRAVEEFGANINATDKLGYARALMYALRACSTPGDDAELIIKYLVNKGAEVDFKHGDKGSNMDSRPYFIYFAICNDANVSDELVYFLVKKGDPKTLTYVPTTKIGSQHGSALDKMKTIRPNLYKKLVSEKIVSNKTNR